METILVVEDEMAVRTGVVDLLLNSGYSVLSAPNGREAIDLLTDNLPDLIISDIMMPDVDGYELLRQVNEKFKANIPFIYLTAKAEYTDVRSGMDLGADDYITKPFRAKDLLAAVKKRLEKSKKNLEKIEEISLNISSYIPHELRTPLVSIIGFTQMMRNEMESYNQDEILEMLGFIEESGLRLYDRIEKFISYASIATKSEESAVMSHEWIQLKTFIESEISQKYPQQMDRINIKLEPAETRLLKDYVKFIANELVENALKFSVETDPVYVDGKIISGTYEIAVKNNSRIDFPITNRYELTPFLQFNREQIQQVGNGLGLVTIDKICHLCGGDLLIKKSDREVTIKVIIPIKQKL